MTHLQRLKEEYEKTKSPDIKVSIDALTKEIKQSRNKGGARKKEYNGVLYDSTIEASFAKQLDDAGLPFIRQVSFDIIEEFTCLGKKVNKERIIVDFLVCGMYLVDTKGKQTDSSRIKWKLLKYHYRDEYEYFLPKSQAEIEEVISYIKSEMDSF